jgi:uncharacterized protein YbjT (DUF2867 family)
MKVVITGANSAVGRAILRARSAREYSLASARLVGLVRSDRAAESLRELLAPDREIVRISYNNPVSLCAALKEAAAVIHLPGVLVERAGSTYEEANVETTRSVVEAAKQSGVRKLVLVSAVGASLTSANRYWHTKAQAEALVSASGLCYTVLRVPLLLGSETEGTASLRRSVLRRRVFLIGGGLHMQQPLDVDDLAKAALRASDLSVASNRILNLVGPVSLPERQLVERTAFQLGRPVSVISIPKNLVRFALRIRRLVTRHGFSPDALEVVTNDSNYDTRPALDALGISLTGIDDMIRKSLGQG